MPLADHLALARTVAGHTGPLVSASTGWLVERSAELEWTDVAPLWLDDSDWYGASARDTSRARAAGLLTSPLQQTLTDALIWELSRPQPGPSALPEGECVRLGAGLVEGDLERSLADPVMLTYELIQAAVPNHAGSVLVDVESC
jgi:2'-hydroxyisoflavone reductase